MKTKVYKSDERGTANHGWLKANFSFSFAHYYNPSTMNFGALRVLNDDIIQGGMGFGTHPHDNMEIITIPLSGSLKHRDSMTNEWIPIYSGEVQVMSAGTGVQHSEMNNHPTEEINLFQIWILPNQQEVEPRYDQKKFEASERKNKLQILVSSIDEPIEGSLKIHQNAQISRIDISNETSFTYELISKTHGVYVMLIDGEIEIENDILTKRDAIGISECSSFKIKAKKESEILFIEVPMNF
ncbi:pirin family protein [Lutibacter sp.]|uniref:pirin family protein n=1 Tax=Lutibacter sp. TaxID=1925666 RepID=UPI0027354536|nr:pirin family protein [Lutibacter sp.]MDP3313999.1 pirin family protein [Lutibacter sp.]